MPLYLDIHHTHARPRGSTLADAHQRHLDVQLEHGAKYLKAWRDDRTQTVSYLLAAPTRDVADALHREMHGSTGAEIVELAESALWRSMPGAVHEASTAGRRHGGVDWSGARRLAQAMAVLGVSLATALSGGGL